MKEWLKRKIEAYRMSDDKRPLIVDVSQADELQDISQQYLMLKKKVVFDLADHESELPSTADIYQFMDCCNDDFCLLYGLGTYLRLKGKDEFKETIHSLLGSSFKTKFLILTFQCGKYFDEKIPKYRDNIIATAEEHISAPSSLVFIPSAYKDIVNAENGLKNALQRVEKTEGEKIYVITEFSKSDFTASMIGIEECQTSYDLLCLKDKQARKISRKLGSEDDWSLLLTKLTDNSVERTMREFLSLDNAVSEIKDWNNKTPFEKWLLFLYLKSKDLKTGDWAIDYAIGKSSSVNDFINNIYYSILSLDHKEEGYRTKYDSWKKLLKDIRDDTIIYQYCSYVQYKNEDALYYLTDNTDNEKKLIIQIIDRYKSRFTKNKLLAILKTVYNDLYEYLADYNYGDEFLTEYFNEYKLLKTLNILTPEFKAKVDAEAAERSYKRRLMYRTEKLDEINYDDSLVYFIDALGAEFLGFIERKCQEKGLVCKASICKANLPTITSKNTEFKSYFAKIGVEVIDEKGLDSLKHDGKDDYDFDKTKLPIHMIEEFKIIDHCLDHIRKKIKSQVIKKAIIVSDHGSTRLAILNTEMIKEDVESVGEHGGRVCKIVPNMKQIPNAIREDEYYVLADYNAFKGGRVGKVEMHGGATVEEAVVPIIEIYEKESLAQIKVLDPVIKVSFKKKAVLHVFSSKKLSHCLIKINGKTYAAQTADGLNYAVELDDINRAGIYRFEVWDDNEIVSSDNSFTVEKESAKTNDLWE